MQNRMNARDVDELLQAREQLNRRPSESEGPTAQNVVFEKFVLYTSDRAHDSGSRKLKAAIEPVREDFRNIDVATLHADEIPEWLDGTPILIDMRERDKVAYKGGEALRVVQETYPFVKI